MLKIGEKHFAIEKIDDCENIYNINYFYLIVDYTWEYIKEKNENKCLILAVNKNKEFLKKYTDLWNRFEFKIRTISYKEKDYIKIKFNSDDDLPLNKSLMFHKMGIIVRFVFKEDGKFYPRFLLHETLCNECKNEI